MAQCHPGPLGSFVQIRPRCQVADRWRFFNQPPISEHVPTFLPPGSPLVRSSFFGFSAEDATSMGTAGFASAGLVGGRHKEPGRPGLAKSYTEHPARLARFSFSFPSSALCPL